MRLISGARRPRRGHRTGERGSVLMLLPAAVLVLFVLAGISVDAAVTFTQQRQLVAAAGDAANDAASALARAGVYGGGEVSLDRAEVDRTVRQVLAEDGIDADAAWSVDGTTVTLRLTRRVDLIFTRAVPGVAHERTVHATVTAHAVLAP
jgi:hypothetical protein